MGKAGPLTAQIGLYSTILHRLHPLFGTVSGHPVMGGNGPLNPKPLNPSFKK